MRQQKRKEIESSVQGLLVKRFNHYLHRHGMIAKEALLRLKDHDVDNDFLQQRLALSVKSLEAAVKAKKSNAWAETGLEKVEHATELVKQASGLDVTALYCLADALANQTKYALNLAILSNGFGVLGSITGTDTEQRAINCLLCAAHTISNAPNPDKKAASIVMDRAKILNWLIQSNHIPSYASLWATAIRASVLTLSAVTDANQGDEVNEKLTELLTTLLDHESELQC
ncbi:hypothetical protein [Vibrio phage vB_VneS_J26]